MKLAVLCLILFCVPIYTFPALESLQSAPVASELKIEVVYEDTKDLIIRLSEEKGFNTKTALRIAECESQYGKFKFNKKSSAKGIYQWTDGTWKFIKAKGSQLDDKENIKQFIKWYPIHPEWWECD